MNCTDGAVDCGMQILISVPSCRVLGELPKIRRVFTSIVDESRGWKVNQNNIQYGGHQGRRF